jgi:membrane protein DedA with SNARE-associated domain/rhodanese-related sulfurtransferase
MDFFNQFILNAGLLVYGLIFLAGLGLPVPLVPLLVLVGASLANAKVHPLAAAILPPFMLSLGDIIWFYIGRFYGVGILKSVCKVSLEQDSCVQRTQTNFKRFGLKAMLFSRFFPGLSTLSAPAAGADNQPISKFILYDLGGVTFYSAFYILLGFTFSGQVEKLLHFLATASGSITYIILTLVTVYIIYKLIMRYGMIYHSRKLSIPALEVHNRRLADPSLLIIDIRGPSDHQVDPFTIPGAKSFLYKDFVAFAQTLPKSTPIYIFCNCPNQASSTLLSLNLRRKGFTVVHPIKDGIIGWRQAQLPVEPYAPIPAPVVVTLTVASASAN